MSKFAKGVTAIRNITILKQTLEELGISFKELSDEKITFGEGYDRCEVDLAEGQIHYDDMKRNFIDKLEQTYGKHFIISEIKKKGHKIDSINKVGENIEVIASY